MAATPTPDATPEPSPLTEDMRLEQWVESARHLHLHGGAGPRWLSVDVFPNRIMLGYGVGTCGTAAPLVSVSVGPQADAIAISKAIAQVAASSSPTHGFFETTGPGLGLLMLVRGALLEVDHCWAPRRVHDGSPVFSAAEPG